MNRVPILKRRGRTLVPALLAAGLILTGGAAARAADAEAGHALAEKWCNACHSIGDEEPRQEDAGPIWSELSARSTDALLAAFSTPHDFMPDFPSLSDADKADLVAYIRSLE